MDDSMHDQPTLKPSHSRKRSVYMREADDDDDANNNDAPTNTQDMPSKRLQNSRGEVIHRQALTYNVQKLLNHLAFTRLYVTANFHAYHPNSSFVIFCMVSGQDELYRALCQALPSLYGVSPTLQALAITTGYVDPNAVADQQMLLNLPLITTAGVDTSVVEDLESFQQNLGAPTGCIAIIDACGNCIWTNADIGGTSDPTTDDLARALTNVLQSSTEDVAMGNG